MSQLIPRMTAIARQAKQDPQRSPLFHWLAKHHGRLASDLTGKRINWAPLVAAAIRGGIKDGLGRDPTVRTIRRTWKDVRDVREGQAAAAAEKPSRKLQPRDLPVGWEPTPLPMATTPVAASPTASQPLSPPASSAHPRQVRVVGQASFGVITRGPLTPEPDYTGMDDADRKIARAKWHIARRQPG